MNTINNTLGAVSLEALRSAPRDPANSADVANLIQLVSDLDGNLQKEIENGIVPETLSDVVVVLSEVWGVLERFYELCKKSPVPRSVTEGNILKYKIIRTFADLLVLTAGEAGRDLCLPNAPSITTFLTEYVTSGIDRKEFRDRSFSHMAVKALVFLDRGGAETATYKTITDGVAAGEFDPAFGRYVAGQLARF